MKVEKVSEDDRGEIWKVGSENSFYFIAKTLKGHSRGGDIHDGEQYLLVLEGKLEVRLMLPGGEEKIEMNPRDFLTVPKDIPHLFIALENSVFLEWGNFPLPSYDKKRFYEPYRKLCR